MQYCCAVILTQRPAACFGTPITEATSVSIKSRSICVQNAIRLAGLTQEYREHHGSAQTMLGTSLYTTTIAAIILIAHWADGGSVDEGQYLSCIDSCLQCLREMKTSYVVARTVLKQLTGLMRRCNIPRLRSDTDPQSIDGDDSVLVQLGQALPLSPVPEDDMIFGQDFLLMMSDCDALRSVGPWTYPTGHPIL